MLPCYPSLAICLQPLSFPGVPPISERGIAFQTVAAQAGKPDADPFDLLCHLAYNAPILTRRQRAERVKKQETAFFNYFGPEAREILSELLEKYAADWEVQFTLPNVLKVPPISRHGTVGELLRPSVAPTSFGRLLPNFNPCCTRPSPSLSARI